MADARSKASKSSSKDEKQVHPAEVQRQAAENTPSPVQPIEVVRNVPELDNEGAETVQVVNKPNLQQSGETVLVAEDDPANKQVAKANKRSDKEQCWNCFNHGKDNKLDDDGVCGDCGFEKEKLYNLDYESQKARQRALAEAGY